MNIVHRARSLWIQFYRFSVKEGTKKFVVLALLIGCVIFFYYHQPPIRCEFTYDNPYSPIMMRDKETRFLDPEVRDFLFKTCHLPYPRQYKAVFLNTLFEFERIWREKLNLTYVLGSGTLLGAYRHGQTIPWNGDLDFYADSQLDEAISEAFNGTAFVVTSDDEAKKSFFIRNGKTKQQLGRWPLINLYFYGRNGFLEMKSQQLTLPYHYIFPVIQIPFEGRMMSVPRCPKEILEIIYGKSVFHQCYAVQYKQKRSKRYVAAEISCSKLYGLFPFVKWRRINDTHTMRLTYDPPKKQLGSNEGGAEVWKKGPTVFMPQC